MKKRFSIYTIFLAPFLFIFWHSSVDHRFLDTEPEKDYHLVWSDEFDYTGLPDSTKWSYDTEGNSWNWGNNELQHYTTQRKENTWVDGKVLHIKAIKEAFEDKEYTSARLITKGKGDWLYGRFEICAKLPSGRGTWPAIWMLPTDWEYGGWPKSGEIDIMEHVGYEPDSVYATAHTEAYNHSINTQKGKGMMVSDCESEFHNYILEWEPMEYRAYVDSTLYFTFKNENKTSKEWPFDKRFHLLLNVAVGGNWGAAKGLDSTIFPQEMLIDYVRVYQKK
ncbi:MAG: glycoside hydrolase family 16 protein [Chloroflexia bacterium]|nr:glycoside hydrolase family 16 protein [Chloroflexia bacterium]